MLNKLVQLFYRITSPNHPRGWLDFHSVEENSVAWVHCHGMEKWDLPNVEFLNVPVDLSGYGHGILMGILEYIKSGNKINNGEHFGGLLVSEDQTVIHKASFYLIDRKDDPDHSNVLRIVDYKKDKNSGFPKELFAAHLIVLAEKVNNPYKQKELFEKAIEIFPGNECASNIDLESEYENGLNKNNYAAYLGLGDYFADTNNFEEAKKYFNIAIRKSPEWAYKFSTDIKGDFGKTIPDEAKRDPRYKFWFDLTKEDIMNLINNS